MESGVVFGDITGLGAPLLLWGCVPMFALWRCHLCFFSCVLLMRSLMLVVSFTSTVILLKANGHLFWQVATRARSTFPSSICYCLNSTTKALTYLSTPGQSSIFTPVPMLSMYCLWILKCAADYSVILCTYEWMPTPTSGRREVPNEKLADNILSSCLFSTNHAEILSS